MIKFNNQNFRQLDTFNLRTLVLLDPVDGNIKRLERIFNLGSKDDRQAKPGHTYVEFRIGKEEAIVELTTLTGEEADFVFSMPEHKNDIGILLQCAIKQQIPFSVEYPDQGKTADKPTQYNHKDDRFGLYAYVPPVDYLEVRKALGDAVERINDNCTDNFRVFPESMEGEYVEQQQGGCCGSYDDEVICQSGNKYFIGFNYGH